MNYAISEIASLIDGEFLNPVVFENSISNIIYDTRKISFPQSSIFIALKGERSDGHNYISLAYKKGLRHFLVQKDIDHNEFPYCNFIKVDSTLSALQLLAQKHREKYNIPVVAITGSNGKTTVKEWLSKALSSKYQVAKSPQSFNSQLGVALSLLLIDDEHEIAVIEAGISKVNEMSKLEKMIQPSFGILTNIGDAHSAGFMSDLHKLNEKLYLFSNCKQLLYMDYSNIIYKTVDLKYNGQKIKWGKSESSDIKIVSQKKQSKQTEIQLLYQSKPYSFVLPFQTSDLIENSMHVISYLLFDGFNEEEIQKEIFGFSAIANRLEIKEGVNHSLLINDSYSSDFASMQMAMEYQDLHHAGKDKIVIFSNFEQQKNNVDTLSKFASLLKEKNISSAIGIGLEDKYQAFFEQNNCQFFENVDSFFESNFDVHNKCVLIKGARKYRLERIFSRLSHQIHETILETDFNAMAHNLKYYKSKLEEGTKIMAVVKAEAYGSGSIQVAQFLENQDIDYLAVALVDEAIKIRNEGCTLPIMIFNAGQSNVETYWEFNLEPEIYSFELLETIAAFAKKSQKPIAIHIKIDSGMNRLGFKEKDFEALISTLKAHPLLQIQSIFSHLSSSENPSHDNFTQDQFNSFERAYSILSEAIGAKPMRHILNTAGILRFPNQQYEMVRLGLGLYGIDETGNSQNKIEKAHTLKSTIIQIKNLSKGESTGYNRSGKAEKDMQIAIVNIGYADGLMRIAGNGNYKPHVNGSACEIVGNICMDVCMIDISGYSNVNVGDKVIFFGKSVDIKELAIACNTISYEIISRISPRIKRLYIYN